MENETQYIQPAYNWPQNEASTTLSISYPLKNGGNVYTSSENDFIVLTTKKGKEIIITHEEIHNLSSLIKQIIK